MPFHVPGGRIGGVVWIRSLDADQRLYPGKRGGADALDVRNLRRAREPSTLDAQRDDTSRRRWPDAGKPLQITGTRHVYVHRRISAAAAGGGSIDVDAAGRRRHEDHVLQSVGGGGPYPGDTLEIGRWPKGSSRALPNDGRGEAGPDPGQPS